MLTIYHLKTCDSCRKAIKALKAGGLDITMIDVRADGVAENTLQNWVEALGYEAVLNTRSTTWRGLTDAEKTNVTPEKVVQLLGQYPTLIKRPVITDGEKITIGWKANAQAVWL